MSFIIILFKQGSPKTVLRLEACDEERAEVKYAYFAEDRL